MDKNLIGTRNKLYSGSPSIFWIMSVFCAFVLMGCIALDLVIPASSILTFPLLFAPILFSCFVTLYTIKFGGTVTIGTTFKIGFTYFRNPNFGCFKLLRNLFKAILVYIIASIVVSLIMNLVYTKIYGQEFIDSYTALTNMFFSFDEEEYLAILEGNSLAVQYLNLSGSIAMSIGTFAFIFGVAFSSLSVYLRINLQQSVSTAVDALYKNFLYEHKREYRKDFWSLNWPLFVLLIVGYAVGYVVVLLCKLELANASIITSMAGILFMIPYLPFFFANMEAIFQKHEPTFKNAGDKMTKDILQRLRTRNDLSEEDKKVIEEMLEGNKKDSDDGNNEES